MQTHKPEKRECESCRYETACTKYDSPLPTGSPLWLCKLCSGTMAGNATRYPNQYPQAELLKTICYVGNTILDSVKLNKESK